MSIVHRAGRRVIPVAVVADGPLAREDDWRLAFVVQDGVTLVDVARAELVVVTGSAAASALVVGRALRERRHVAYDRPLGTRDVTAGFFAAAVRHQRTVTYVHPLARPVALLANELLSARPDAAEVVLALGTRSRGVDPASAALDALGVALPVVAGALRPRRVDRAAVPGTLLAATLRWRDGASLDVTVEQGDDPDDQLELRLRRDDELVRLSWTPASGEPFTCERTVGGVSAVVAADEHVERRLADCYAGAAADLLADVRRGRRRDDGARAADHAVVILEALRADVVA